MDRHSGVAPAGGRAREARPPGGSPARARHRAASRDQGGGQRRAPRARRLAGGESPHRLVHFPRPDRRRQNGARARAGGVSLRRRAQHGAARHERVHGKALRRAAHRRAARVRRLRGGRPAHRGRAAQAVLRGAVRRDREGARGCLQRAAAGARRRPHHRWPGPHRRLQEHRHHHDEQPRLAAHPRDGECGAARGAGDGGAARGISARSSSIASTK